MLRINGSDGIVEVDIKIARKCKIIDNIFIDCCKSEKDFPPILEFSFNYSKRCLERIFTFCENFDNQFICALSNSELQELIIASNFLEMEILLYMGVEQVANILRKNNQETRALLKMEGDSSMES